MRAHFQNVHIIFLLNDCLVEFFAQLLNREVSIEVFRGYCFGDQLLFEVLTGACKLPENPEKGVAQDKKCYEKGDAAQKDHCVNV